MLKQLKECDLSPRRDPVCYLIGTKISIKSTVSTTEGSCRNYIEPALIAIRLIVVDFFVMQMSMERNYKSIFQQERQKISLIY